MTPTPILNALTKSAQRSHAAFYAPGHKQGKGISNNLKKLLGNMVFQADLPELPELDNLFAPDGAIRDAQELASVTYGAAKTWFLVNGSTCGIMAAIIATCGPGDKVILPRNIHQSAIAGLVFSGAIPIFINPEYDITEGLAYNITSESLEQTLKEHPDAKAVMMLHPNYQGVCSDLPQIAKITHQYNIPLLVDEAHGAHFAFHDDLPPSAMSVGADLTVQSTHKVLSAMTQASMLHTQGNRVCDRKIGRALQLLQSTSPSYLLLASLDAAREQMATQGQQLMNRTITLAIEGRSRLAEIAGLSVFNPKISPGCQFFDDTRLTINVSGLGITGFAADKILHEQLGVTCELPLLNHLTFIISLGNNGDDIQKLIQACQIFSRSKRLESSVSLDTQSNQGQDLSSRDIKSTPKLTANANLTPLPSQKSTQPLSPRDAYWAIATTTAIDKSVNQICGELICPYPPGIPLLMPGEIITAEAIQYLQQILMAGGTITGCNDPRLETIQILK